MTYSEFIDYLLEEGVVKDPKLDQFFRNPINGSYARIEDRSGDQRLKAIEVSHHCAMLGVGPPDEFEDFYHVYLAFCSDKLDMKIPME